MKLGSIQLLRAIAVILIVYAHSINLTQRFAPSLQESFYNLSNWGFIGIDLFFVISGFTITYVAGDYIGINDGLKFLKKRFFRINPIYYMGSVLFSGVTLLEMWITQKTANLSGSHYLSASIDTFFIVPLANSHFLYGPILPIGWTLAFVWLFYLIFSFTILTRVKRKILLLSGIIILLVILKYLLPAKGLRLFFLTNPIMLELLLGVIICQLYLLLKKIPLYIPIILLVMSFAWYLALVFYNNPNLARIPAILTGGLSMERFLYWGLPSSFIVAGCLFLEKGNKLNSLWNNKAGSLLGDASYSIYLVHMSIFVLIGIIYKKFSLMPHPDLSILIQLVIALGIGVAFHQWVEKPLLSWFQESTPRLPSTTTIPATSTT